MKRKKRKPEPAAGYLAICLGIGCLGIAMLSSMSSRERRTAVGAGLIGLLWGAKEFAAARKWDQESKDKHEAISVRDQLESERFEKMKKSGSMTNVLAILKWFSLIVVVLFILSLVYLMLFHHDQ
ncbi:MAG TPA: hypothetical protein VN048_08180 [Verrucomicrobiae bacterium]|jgi:hypothetical protein|nr:hypothetical protein [Verrucomicrobiae bacterium]